MPRRSSAPVADPDEDVRDESEEAEGEEVAFCTTDVAHIPPKEWALYRRVSTILHKAGITEPDKLLGMSYRERRRIPGLGANGLELIQETLATGEEDRTKLLFQEPGKKTASAKYGPNPFTDLPPFIGHRLAKGGVESTAQLREMSDEQLRDVKGLGKSAIVKVREKYGPPPLTDRELDTVEARPGKVKASVVKALIAEVRSYRDSAPSSNGNGTHADAEEADDFAAVEG